MTTECPVCRGTGLVGAGPEPHLHVGNVVTCGNCGGTGKVEEGVVAEVAPTVEEAPALEAQTPSSEVQEVVVQPGEVEVVAAVDNTEIAPAEEGVTLETATEEVLG